MVVGRDVPTHLKIKNIFCDCGNDESKCIPPNQRAAFLNLKGKELAKKNDTKIIFY